MPKTDTANREHLVKTPRVLIADDIRDVVLSLAASISYEFDIEVALSGSDVLRRCSERRFSAVVIDVDFEAGMSGLEVVELLRRSQPELKILVISAVDYSDDVKQAALSFGADFCEKPVSGDFLRGWLRGEH